jgi:imidazolonepropionase-like amidohydrolase
MKRFIRFGVACCTLALLAVSTAPRGESQGQNADVLVIDGGTLIDGNGGQPVADSVIVIRGNRIESVSRKGQAAIPAGAKVLNAAGKYVVPGLMDAHVHYADYMGEAMVNHGVTSIFEVGGGEQLVRCWGEPVWKGR